MSTGNGTISALRPAGSVKPTRRGSLFGFAPVSSVDAVTTNVPASSTAKFE
jgi:hypothetical protein